MKRKVLTIVLLFSLLLAGCSQSADYDGTMESEDTWEEDSGYEEDMDYESDGYESDDYESGTDNESDTDEKLDAEEASDESSYIMPDSYDITGKWKSIGSSGFGQAQPGAIIIFDGIHCNFYSPYDTYAFYIDEGSYVLDTTSVLGENLSFTVKIIDNDNIEVSSASLKRVE